MSTPIENNTEELQELLRIANNLPEAVEPPVFQDKTVSPTTEKQTVTPDPDYDGLSSVTVNAMPTAEQATPSISVSDSGLITASATQEEGYVEAGTKSGTKQLTTQGAKTITPSESAQTAVESGVFTTGAVTVDPIPSSYVQPSGTLPITENGTHNVRNYEAVNVEVEQGMQLPELDNPGTASDLAEGMELIDAEGKKVTGTLRKKVSLTLPEEGVTPAAVGISGDSNCTIAMIGVLSEDVIFSKDGFLGDALSVIVPQSEMYQFGDATEADVTAGKTFTSAAGVKKTGTRPEPTTETWVFTLENGSTVTKEVHIE